MSGSFEYPSNYTPSIPEGYSIALESETKREWKIKCPNGALVPAFGERHHVEAIAWKYYVCGIIPEGYQLKDFGVATWCVTRPDKSQYIDYGSSVDVALNAAKDMEKCNVL